MRLLGNILWWFLFFGFVDAVLAYLAGIFFCVTVVGAPIGLGLFQLGNFYLAPFSYEMVDAAEVGEEAGLGDAWNLLAAVLWLPIGIFLFFSMALRIGALFLSIVGIPAALGLTKSLGAILNPVGKVCRPWPPDVVFVA
jgi:uncharacterized membrane protein YccF (DUF307 family)